MYGCLFFIYLIITKSLFNHNDGESLFLVFFLRGIKSVLHHHFHGFDPRLINQA